MVIAEDELLKWRFRRGSPEALARIYEKYLDSMLTLGHRAFHLDRPGEPEPGD
ncbi:hypothetical protein [Anaerobaca lacustris]|uniref:Uncharacterized protein n=1 Tax=Anaerobaca lacustris TaxID=3044600 RepID=A0AAW6TVD2_9BACT|nr:hypothetical protein [Sedimentisphaerales bacterium M17dextr]